MGITLISCPVSYWDEGFAFAGWTLQLSKGKLSEQAMPQKSSNKSAVKYKWLIMQCARYKVRPTFDSVRHSKWERVHSVTLFSWDHFICTAKEAMENHSDKKEECRKWMIGIQGWKRCRDWHGDGTALWCMQRSKRMQKTFNVLHDELLVSSSSPLNLIQEIIDIKLQWNVYWKVHRHLLLSCNLCWEVPPQRYLFPEGYEELRLQSWELYVVGCFHYLGKKLWLE